MSAVIEERPRRNPALRLVTVPVSIVAIIATTLLGSWMITNQPGGQDIAAPFFYSGRAGEVIDHPLFTVEVLGVRGATKVRDTRDNAFTTDGVFVLVETRIVAKAEPLHLITIQAVDNAGRTFTAVDRLSQGITSGYRFEPDIPVEADLAFEIPPDAGPGLRLWLGQEFFVEMNYFQNVAEVDLGIDQGAVDRWRAERRTLDMKLPILKR